MSKMKSPRKQNQGHKGSGGKKEPDAIVAELIALMEQCPTAENLNERVITPFSVALEKVCLARGYLLNIYGEGSNVVISSEDDAETIYHLVNEYLDQSV